MRTAIGATETLRSHAPSRFLPAILAVLTMAGMWVTGWLVGMLVKLTGLLPGLDGTAVVGSGGTFLHWAMFALGYLTLAAILVTVEIARFVFRRRGPRPSGDHQRPAEASS